MSEKLVYATGDHTVHLAQGTVDNQFGSFEIVEGYNLASGQSVPLSKLAKYQQEAIEAGTVPGLEVLSEKDAAKKTAEFEKVKALVAGAASVTTQTQVSLGDDGSYSDHLVSDAQKIANHAAEAGGGEAVVATAENEDSPVYAGVTDEPEVVEENVVGSGGEEAAPKKSK